MFFSEGYPRNNFRFAVFNEDIENSPIDRSLLGNAPNLISKVSELNKEGRQLSPGPHQLLGDLPGERNQTEGHLKSTNDLQKSTQGLLKPTNEHSGSTELFTADSQTDTNLNKFSSWTSKYMGGDITPKVGTKKSSQYMPTKEVMNSMKNLDEDEVLPTNSNKNTTRMDPILDNATYQVEMNNPTSATVRDLSTKQNMKNIKDLNKDGTLTTRPNSSIRDENRTDKILGNETLQGQMNNPTSATVQGMITGGLPYTTLLGKSSNLMDASSDGETVQDHGRNKR